MSSSYIQQTSQGCLPVCLIKIVRDELTLEKEVELLISGLKFKQSYAYGVVSAFCNKYQVNVEFFIHNQYYWEYLRSVNRNHNITLTHKKVDLNLISNLDKPLVVYVDNKVLGDYIHTPHFILIENEANKFYSIFDPWDGKIVKIKRLKLIEGVSQLKLVLKYSPILIKVDDIISE